MKICSFGSLNLDNIYRVEEMVRPGETISAAGVQSVCGGKGLNQSVAMARAGASVFHAGNVGGDDAGRMLRAALEADGVDTSLLRELPMRSGHTVIQVSDSGENAIIVSGGANKAVDSAQIEDVLSRFGEGDLLVMQNEINAIPEIMAKAHARGMRLAFNPSPITASLSDVPVQLCDILFVNEIEAGRLCGADTASLDQLAARFPKAAIVYTMGSRGAYARADGKTHFQPAFRVQAVDTTGAGDTFTGYFLAAVCEGKAMPEALHLAAAISVTRMGASVSVPARGEVEAWTGGE